jgi:signal transduction histidine kinase
MVQKLLLQVEKLNRMVGELLDYSRGNIRLSLSPLSLGDLFAKLADQYLSQLKAKKVELRIDNQVIEPLLVDQERLMRVFSNLIDNALKAMRRGGVLGLKSFRQGGDVIVHVSDTGEGMPEEVVKNLFEPFFSASSSGGTGLGMVVVANVIEAHQGTVNVSSVPGEGTKIELKLPLHRHSLV